MSKRPWHGIMKVLEIQQWRNGEKIWEAKNLNNLLHYDGEEFILRAAFTGGQDSSVIPDNYFLGLDDREFVAAADTMATILNEPAANGYTRQQLSSSGDLTVTQESGHFRATSKIVSFRAEGGSWGPVRNLFLTDLESDDGYLISSVPLGVSVEVNDGDAVTLRIALTLRDCPPE